MADSRKKVARAKKAGVAAAESFIEMVHLMYQKNTALNFLHGFIPLVTAELERREKEKEREKYLKFKDGMTSPMQ